MASACQIHHYLRPWLLGCLMGGCVWAADDSFNPLLSGLTPDRKVSPLRGFIGWAGDLATSDYDQDEDVESAPRRIGTGVMVGLQVEWFPNDHFVFWLETGIEAAWTQNANQSEEHGVHLRSLSLDFEGSPPLPGPWWTYLWGGASTPWYRSAQAVRMGLSGDHPQAYLGGELGLGPEIGGMALGVSVERILEREPDPDLELEVFAAAVLLIGDSEWRVTLTQERDIGEGELSDPEWRGSLDTKWWGDSWWGEAWIDGEWEADAGLTLYAARPQHLVSGPDCTDGPPWEIYAGWYWRSRDWRFGPSGVLQGPDTGQLNDARIELSLRWLFP